MKLNKHPAAMIRILLFGIGLMLSCNVFAGKPVDKTFATVEDLSTEASDRTDADTVLYGYIDAAIADALPELPAERFEAVLKICGNSDTPQWGACYYSVGNTGPGGGIVFYITDGGLHGLEAAPEDQDSAKWGCYAIEVAGADGTAIGTGAQNTADILAGCAESPIAAEIADNYELNGYTDWFLPSKDELHELYTQKNVVGGFANYYYWSSSEVSDGIAWTQDFFTNDEGIAFQGYHFKVNSSRVRAVRAF